MSEFKHILSMNLIVSNHIFISYINFLVRIVFLMQKTIKYRTRWELTISNFSELKKITLR